MNPFLSTTTLLGVAVLPADAEARRTLLRAARRRWQSDFQLEGETMLLHGNAFTLSDILQRIDALEQEEEGHWHTLLQSAPELHTFLETGTVSTFRFEECIGNWPEKEAARATEAFSWQYLQLFRRAWKNGDTSLMKALGNLPIPGYLELADDVDDLLENYREMETEKLQHAFDLLLKTGTAGEALQELCSDQRLHFWKVTFGTFYELRNIYTGWYYLLKRRKAPAEELDAVIEALEKAALLFGGLSWDLKQLIADHKRPDPALADDEDADDDDDELTPAELTAAGYNPDKRKKTDADEDPYPIKKKKWYSIEAASLIPMLALAIAFGFIGWGVWSAMRDKKDDKTAEQKRPHFEMRYYPTAAVYENKSISVNDRRIAYDSLFLAIFHRLSEGADGLPMNKKKLLDSLYNKELMELILNDSVQTKSNARGIADSLTPIVLPHRDPTPY
jgi:hypothetical protein